MKLARRFPLFFSFLFSAIIAIVMLVVYLLFANFRKIEFQDRLEEKVESTVKLLLEVKAIDRQLLRIIDSNSINRLYNEKTLIFDQQMRIIYSSIDDAVIRWSPADLDLLRQRKTLFRKYQGRDELGMHYSYEGQEYYALISAEDKYGNRKLNYLRLILLGAFLASTLAIWVISFSLSKKTLRPLNRLRRQMQDITSKNLAVRVQEPGRDDEIRELSSTFNQMLDRIDRAYESQKDFTTNASHELRTPLFRILSQLENLLHDSTLPPRIRPALGSMSEDLYQLSDIVTSLLLLSRTEEESGQYARRPLRLDEVLFSAADRLKKTFPDFRLKFNVDAESAAPLTMEVLGDETLLAIALTNLLRNAYSYSSDQGAACVLSQDEKEIVLRITNNGPTPQVGNPDDLFEMFVRGSNSAGATGSGIGLSIVKRILAAHGGSIRYEIPAAQQNRIVLRFPAAPARAD